MTILAVLADLIRHPYNTFVRRWNWKAAVCSAVIRSILFFAVILPAGRAAAAGAMIVEMIFRCAASGFFGALTQELSLAEPAWAAAVLAGALLPLVNQVLEYALHALRNTPRLAQSMTASIIFTVISTLFNLYIQRRGLLIVGEREQKPLGADLAAVPAAIMGFVTLPFRALLRRT